MVELCTDWLTKGLGRVGLPADQLTHERERVCVNQEKQNAKKLREGAKNSGRWCTKRD